MNRIPEVMCVLCLTIGCRVCEPPSPQATSSGLVSNVAQAMAEPDRVLHAAQERFVHEGYDAHQYEFSLVGSGRIWITWLRSPAGRDRLGRDDALLSIIAGGDYAVVHVERAGVLSNWGAMIVIDKTDLTKYAFILCGG